jgi:hypothetical protein
MQCLKHVAWFKEMNFLIKNLLIKNLKKEENNYIIFYYMKF